MSDKALVINTSEVEKQMRQVLSQVSSGGSRRAIRQALNTLRLQARDISPTVPHVTGILRGDEGVKSEYSPEMIVNAMATLVEGTLVFLAPYAAYQHEGMRRDGSHVVVHHSEPGSGTKFLEAKLARADLRLDILRVMGEVIKKDVAAGGGGESE